MSSGTIVVIGAGQAGAWAVRTLRAEGYAGRIVLCGDEPHAPYERPPLSKAVLGGSMPPHQTELLSASALAELDVEFLASKKVQGIDPAARHVTLSDGTDLPYDKLLLCTGGRAFVPPLAGADQPGIYTLRTLDDAQRLGLALRAGRKRLAVVGGGWIGLEVAATARQEGCQVTVIEAAPRLCSRSVMPEVSDYLAGLHRSREVAILTGTQVRAISAGESGEKQLLLADGRKVLADIVVLGAGLLPNDELARLAGLSCDGGVIVDEQCRSSDPHIYAAGDVTVIEHDRSGGRLRLESWQNAQDQGVAAARAVLGLPVAYAPIPLVWSEQYDSMIQISGFAAQSITTVVRPLAQPDSLLVFGLDAQSCVVCAIGVNAGRDFRLARKWVEERRPVDAALLRDAATSLAAHKAVLVAASA